MNTFVYEIENALYINLTNRCTNRCRFCVRNGCSGVGGHHLWLDREPAAEEVLTAMGDFTRYEEIVFCGFGEPMIKIAEIIAISSVIKEKELPVRINTNGQANLFHGRNVVPELKGLVDVVSVSLNAPDAVGYQALCDSDYGEAAFEGLIEFTRECVKVIPRVVLSVVDVLREDEIEACKRLAGELGADLRLRSML